MPANALPPPPSIVEKHHKITSNCLSSFCLEEIHKQAIALNTNSKMNRIAMEEG